MRGRTGKRRPQTKDKTKEKKRKPKKKRKKLFFVSWPLKLRSLFLLLA
jgi:hypothetical protein